MLKYLNLRLRLLLSYLLILMVSLGVITAAFLAFLSARPAPTTPTYNRLGGVLQGLNVARDLTAVRPVGSSLTLDDVRDVLRQIADEQDVRVIAFNDRSDNVFFDSENAFIGMQSPELHILQQSVVSGAEIIIGNFYDADENEWLFVGTSVLRGPRTTIYVMLAEQRPTQSLVDALQELGSVLAVPLLQAGMVGLAFALILALLISRSIARPLLAVARAAPHVVAGHFELRVPVNGPPEVRDVAQAFNQMSTEVRTTQQSQRDFLANVSHDLKTPLTSIQGYSMAIIDGTAKNPAHAAAIIHDEAERLNRMVIELTDLARIQAGRLSMKSAAIDMGAIVAAMTQRLSVVANKKNVTLEVDADGMPPIAGDGDRLAQVVTNLVSNAIKYTPPNGHVWVTTRINNGGVEVIVKDTGIGIPKEDLPRIFERFYQVDKTRGPSRGTGLGLAIVYEIVQAHGGEIRVFSDGKNKGTTFSIWLPSPHLSTVVNRKR